MGSQWMPAPVAGRIVMPRKTKPKAKKAMRKATAAKRPAKRSGRSAARKTPVARAARPQPPAPPRLSREAVEEVLVHSAKSSEDEWLSDKTLSEIAICANLDPSRVLDVHRRLCEAADDSGVTILRVVELWEPYE
jgi:hypothetical protein